MPGVMYNIGERAHRAHDHRRRNPSRPWKSSARAASACTLRMSSAATLSATKRIFFCVPSMSVNSRCGQATASGMPGKPAARAHVDDASRIAEVRRDRQAVEHVQREDAFGRDDGREVHVLVAFAQHACRSATTCRPADSSSSTPISFAPSSRRVFQVRSSSIAVSFTSVRDELRHEFVHRQRTRSPGARTSP